MSRKLYLLLCRRCSLVLTLTLIVLAGWFALPEKYSRVLLPTVSAATTFTVTNTGDSGPGSFRQAMLDANSSAGLDTIVFNIPGSGVQTITPTATLPEITDPVIIDGRTQPGFAGTPLIELNGNSIPSIPNRATLSLTTGNCTIRGLIINRFRDGAIALLNGGNNLIEGNYIGTSAAGTSAPGSSGIGIRVDNSANNIIGGTTALARNVIAGTNSHGISMTSLNATGNTIQGNYIGTNAAGTVKLGNLAGIFLGSSNNLVGGTTAGARNVISGNGYNGITMQIDATFGNIIQGNYIGTDASGSVAIPNIDSGIAIFSTSNNTIGGTTPGAGNLISGNTFAGVKVIGDTNSSDPTRAAGNVIQGNYIGTNAAGTAAIPNGLHGVYITGAKDTLVGGTTADARNVISGNTSTGIYILGNFFGPGHKIQGNYIGTNAAGDGPISNGVGLALFNAKENVIGGADAGAGNIIAYNNGKGVLIDANQPGTKNIIRGNSFFSNGDLGIDLGGTGITPNDAGDADTGVNNLQNFPLLTSVSSGGGTTTIQGTLNSTPGATFHLEFFASRACDASGNGEGAQFLGSASTTTDGAGNAGFNAILPVALAAGQVLTATATDPAGNSSEFSPCFGSGASGSLQFSALSYPVSEDINSATVTVTRTGGTAGTITVNYATGNGTAIAGADYAQTSGTLTFADGETSKTFTVQVINDGVAEPIETVNLTLSGTPDKELLGAPNTAVLRILDSATPLELSMPLFVSVIEGDTGTFNATFTITLSAATSRTVTVNYGTQALNATAGVDFQAVTGTVTFNPGVRTQTIVVPIIGDLIDEFDETFNFQLGSPTNAVVTSGNTSVTILDNDPPPSLTINDISILEGDSGVTTAVFTVTRSAESGKPIMAQLVAASGTAELGIDFRGFNGPVFTDFLPGQLEAKVSVVINGDTLNEPDETFFLNIANAPNATISDGQGVGTILNDDGATPIPNAIQFNQSFYSVSEGVSFINVAVTRSGDISAPASVKYLTSDGTNADFRCNQLNTGIASRKCDYHIAVGTIRFAAGENSKQFALSFVNDVYVEGPENFNLTLINPIGGTLGANKNVPVTITDDDTAGTANPIDNTQFFVRQLYVDLLSREPDPAGWNGWTSRIDLCGQPGQAPPPCDRVTVAGDGFLRSGEFFDRQFFVIRLYRTGLGRILRYEDVGDLAYVSGFLTSQELELNKQDLVNELVGRAEFANRYNPLSNAAFVPTLLQTAGVSVPQTVVDDWVSKLETNQRTRAQIFREISERAEVSARYAHEAQVVSAYYGFFTRNPDGAYLNYLQRLDSGEINLGDLANAFINAQEYRQRFGQ